MIRFWLVDIGPFDDSNLYQDENYYYFIIIKIFLNM
jgi:hypothetical protein